LHADSQICKRKNEEQEITNRATKDILCLRKKAYYEITWRYSQQKKNDVKFSDDGCVGSFI
jgi:hypothetical protein